METQGKRNSGETEQPEYKSGNGSTMSSPMITLNVNGLNTPIKHHRVPDGLKNEIQIHSASRRLSFKDNKTLLTWNVFCVRLFADMAPVLHIYLCPCILQSDIKHLPSCYGVYFSISVSILDSSLFVWFYFCPWNMEKMVTCLKRIPWISDDLFCEIYLKNVNKCGWATQGMRGHVEQGLSVPVKAMIDQPTANWGPSMLELSPKSNIATLAHLQVDKDTRESQQKSKQFITYVYTSKT